MTNRLEYNELDDDLKNVELAIRNGSLVDALSRVIAPIIAKGIRANFNSSANPDGVNWKPRKNPGDGHPLLMDTGALIQSATGGGSGHIRKVNPRSITMGTDGMTQGGGIKSAALHNRGSGRMPQREFMGVPEKFLLEIDEAIADAGMDLIG